MDLIDRYPQFKELYEDIYDLCLNTERITEMFSKELRELDRNTVRYMIDEMQTEIDVQAATINNQTKQLAVKDQQLADKEAEVEQLKKRIAELEQK